MGSRGEQKGGPSPCFGLLLTGLNRSPPSTQPKVTLLGRTSDLSHPQCTPPVCIHFHTAKFLLMLFLGAAMPCLFFSAWWTSLRPSPNESASELIPSTGYNSGQGLICGPHCLSRQKGRSSGQRPCLCVLATSLAWPAAAAGPTTPCPGGKGSQTIPLPDPGDRSKDQPKDPGRCQSLRNTVVPPAGLRLIELAEPHP